MQTFVLDGFVTEHVNMLLDINKLYKFLGRIEKVSKRQYKMLGRRLQLLQEIFIDLNKQAFEGLW